MMFNKILAKVLYPNLVDKLQKPLEREALLIKGRLHDVYPHKKEQPLGTVIIPTEPYDITK